MSVNPETVSSDPKPIVVRSIHHMARGNRADFDDVIAANGFTHERRAAPPSARGNGPGRLLRTRTVAARRVRGSVL